MMSLRVIDNVPRRTNRKINRRSQTIQAFLQRKFSIRTRECPDQMIRLVVGAIRVVCRTLV